MVKVSQVLEADVPEDGGKWMLLCEHEVNGITSIGGVLQDSNKRRLAAWRTSRWADGLTTWCPTCQELHEYDA